MKEYKILAPTGIVGYGFPEDSFYAGVAQKPDLIACDAGSTDPGPYYLGAGTPFTNPTAVRFRFSSLSTTSGSGASDCSATWSRASWTASCGVFSTTST